MNTDKTRRRDYRIERMREEDAPRLAELERGCFSHPWTEEQLALGLREGVLHVYGLLDRLENLVGYASFYAVAGEGELINIAVREEHRGGGLGRHLLGGMLQTAKEMGIQSMLLEVRESNAPAVGLYSSFGFSRVGRRKGYYPDTGEDALLMRLTINS
ncbi:ribosomal protein S18-alanine N-acetyltransferase [Desulfohalovibrio reitneri]|uniref:ribosomal protein S18-alanine N-acetyltransferase n=1 Tax=Desulfohalovibrio reitneri TaxID=1307759 RepID=UPI0004A6B3D3|nr:ribosomal protein S18-alanine N-acetyltransferase [Desulfohalovibrio reitneri]